MKSLPPIEKKIYEYIKKVISEKGYSPSIRDIQNELLIKSTSTVYFHLKHLEEHGFIYRENGKSRAITLNCDFEELRNRIPVLGHITNGSLLDPEENFDGYVVFSVPPKYKRDGLFAVRINSTVETPDELCDGDTIIVSKDEMISEGDMMVVFENGNISVQKNHKNINELSPDKTLKASDFKETKTLGKVIAFLRFC